MPAMDPSIIGQLAMQLSRDDYLMILGTFDTDFARLAGELQAAVAAGDVPAYRRAAHALAGAAAGAGAGPLEAVSRLAMDPANADDPATLARRIAAETGSTRAAIAELIAAAPPED